MPLTPNSLPISLYIHIPWCIKKCPYCDFNSHPLTKGLPESEYIEALLIDLKASLPLLGGRKAHSIFFGGGTPSLFSGEALDLLLTDIDRVWPLPKGVEITLEANPGASDQNRFKQYRDIGINRLSIGVQSFKSESLLQIGRIHSSTDAIAAIHAAKEVGYTDFNLDLMFGLPGQSVEDALQDLETAFSFMPSHLSWYQLTIEPNTYFDRHPPQLPHEDEQWSIFQAGLQKLAAVGFQQYEVSAFYRTKPAIHNLNYWEFGDYLGIGAGAHSKITDLDGIVHRMQRVRSPAVYLDPARDFIAKQYIVSRDDLVFEYMLNALRLTQGIKRDTFEKRTGLPLETIEPLLIQAQAKGWLRPTTDVIQTTALGHQFLNDLTLLFIPEND
ncbi:MAG: radical SAM family heme chaperone HemW [Gammaproteobacteria bacterium]